MGGSAISEESFCQVALDAPNPSISNRTFWWAASAEAGITAVVIIFLASFFGVWSAIIVYGPIHTFSDDNAPGVRSCRGC